MGWPWLTEQETLHLGAALRSNRLELSSCFDAFGGCLHTQPVGQRSYGTHNVESTRALRDVLDERTINLDLVEREALQIAERGVSGAEVVHHDSYPQFTQLIEGV